MALVDLFRRKKLSLMDVKIEKVRLENKEKQLTSKIDELSREKEAIFRRGSDSTSKSLRMIYARRFEEITKRLQLMEKDSLVIWKQLRLISVLHTVYERKAGPTKAANILYNLSNNQMAELLRLIDSHDVKEAVFNEKLETMLSTLDERLVDVTPLGDEGIELMKVWESMDEGKLEFEEGYKTASESTEKRLREKLS